MRQTRAFINRFCCPRLVYGAIILVLNLPITVFADADCTGLLSPKLSLSQKNKIQSDQEIEGWLRNGTVISIQENSKESTGATYWVELKVSGTAKKITAIFKPNTEGKPSEYRAEEASYKYDRFFGFNVTPVTVTRSIDLMDDGEMIEGSLQLQEKISPWASVSAFNKVLKNNPSLEKQYYIIRLMHHLIFNKDVNIQNIQLNRENKLVAIDHEFAFGFMDPFGESKPVHVHAFPKNIDFKIFKSFYEKISALSEKQYAKIIAPLVAFSQGFDVENMDAYRAQRLNWIMGCLMEARDSFLSEMELRLPELRGKNYFYSNQLKELLPYDYFKESSDSSKSTDRVKKSKKKSKNR